MALSFIDAVFDLVREPLSRLIPDKNARQKFEHELTITALKSGLAQMDVNRQEARHASLFVAGWRPFVGWVCGFALLWHFIVYDLLNWIRLVYAPESAPPPDLSGTETLITVLLSMLGLGGLRTYEKLKGISREQLSSTNSAQEK